MSEKEFNVEEFYEKRKTFQLRDEEEDLEKFDEIVRETTENGQFKLIEEVSECPGKGGTIKISETMRRLMDYFYEKYKDDYLLAMDKFSLKYFFPHLKMDPKTGKTYDTREWTTLTKSWNFSGEHIEPRKNNVVDKEKK